jgi:hypothetical protein
VSQSAIIGGALLFAFVLFLAARNRLAAYGAVLWGAVSSGAPATTGPGVSVGAAGSTAAAPTASQLSPRAGTPATPASTPVDNVAEGTPTTSTSFSQPDHPATPTPQSAFQSPTALLKQAFSFSNTMQNADLNAASELGLGLSIF